MVGLDWEECHGLCYELLSLLGFMMIKIVTQFVFGISREVITLLFVRVRV